jgi:hypothetical protein
VGHTISVVANTRQRNVIAHFRKGDVLLQATIVAFLAIGCIATTLYFPGGRSWVYIAERPMLFPGTLFIWSGGSLMLTLAAVAFYRVFFDRAVALWLVDGKLVYLGKWLFSVRCRDIEGIIRDTLPRSGRDCIAILVRDGGKKALPIGSLVETRDVILGRLRVELGAVVK